MNQKVIKPGIIRRMVEKIESNGQSIPPEIADMCVTAFLNTVTDILSEGDTVILRGYMTLYPKYCKSKGVKNVMDKSIVTIPAHYKAGIKAGKKDYILKLADSCKGKVQDCLYNAMVN